MVDNFDSDINGWFDWRFEIIPFRTNTSEHRDDSIRDDDTSISEDNFLGGNEKEAYKDNAKVLSNGMTEDNDKEECEVIAIQKIAITLNGKLQ